MNTSEPSAFAALKMRSHVLDGIVYPETFVNQRPREAFFTQYLILGIDKDARGIIFVDVHASPCGGLG
jgi:hypothetical protein